MLTKNFFKTVLIFSAMIIIALLGVLWITGFEFEEAEKIEPQERFAE